MNTCLGILRMLIGLLQSALMLGGCASLLLAPDYLGFCIVAFLLLCGMQLAIVLIIVGMNWGAE